jgi:7-cyano-7-deazaguanine synthase in queuosine biosynthesis
MKQFEFACGGAPLPVPDPDVQRLTLEAHGDDKNINLRISDISRSMVSNVPDLLLDLLEIASYIYCADQRASRGSEKLAHAGREWRRSMHFTVPVRYPEIWSGTELSSALHETLSFLSDDTYQFSFVDAKRPFAEKEVYFDNLFDDANDADEVALFSGGIDSFAGAIETIAGLGRKTVLVGHHSAPKVFAVQKELVASLRKAGHADRFLYVPVNVTNTGVQATETTQRSRSFLYASLAFVIARMFGKSAFTFFENGVVSFNLPIARDVLGGRATRTTHPKVIRGFEAIFSALAGERIEVRTPYIWLTKKEVVGKILENGFGHLLSSTVSCVHPMLWTTSVRHCGVCSQCIDRRFAVLAAGAEEFEPDSDYAIDLLTGDRSLDEQIRMAVAYVKFCQAVADCPRNQFIAQNPQVTAALRYLPELSCDQARDQIWDLHRRHAAGVLSVIENGLHRHGAALARGTLPLGSLLSLCFSRAHADAPPPADYDHQVGEFMDRLARPVCEFAFDADAKRIWFKGDYYLDGANFTLIAALIENYRSAKAQMTEVPFMETWKLADELEIDEDSLRQRVTRLRKEVTDRLAVDQGIVLHTNDFIENRQREGYRLAPALREVTRADLLPAVGPVSHPVK